LDNKVTALYDNVCKVIVGKGEVVKLAITALLARGHLLIEDAPGLGKTMLARAIAQSIDAGFKRIQFTPDLLPSDVTGISVYVPTKESFEFFPGPIFSQIVLADEINRTSPRTQASLLEAMEERQVTIDGETHSLSEPFFVVATQNPIELEGTYPLPEAQLDRFLMKIRIGYPKPRDEMRILAEQMHSHPIDAIRPVLRPEELREFQEETLRVHVGPEIQQYVVALVSATRKSEDTRLGVSPRGGLALMRAAQAHAFLHQMSYVTPDSVKAVAPHVLSHRILLQPQREYSGATPEAVVAGILKEIPVPTLPNSQVTPHAPERDEDPGEIAGSVSSKIPD